VVNVRILEDDRVRVGPTVATDQVTFRPPKGQFRAATNASLQ
jgi:hypothetical protein